MKRNLTKPIFILYCMILLWVILLKMAASLEELRLLAGNRVINLVPLDYGVPIGIPQIREAALNFLLFLPMGVYLKVFGYSGKQVVFRGFCLSLSFEIFQYILAIGITDITDLMTNTLGAAVGAGFYWLLRKLTPDKEKADRAINTVAITVILLFAAMTALLTIAN